jgi:hypothetical protein
MNKQALLARRVREIRQSVFGDHGLENLAAALDIPVKTWLNYERGVTMPAHVLLQFLQVTNTDAQSLLADEFVFPTIRIE